MDFPIAGLMDQDACYQKLLGPPHPAGLACPTCKSDENLRVHRRDRAPVLDYRCKVCGRVFNAFTGTALAGTHRRPGDIMLILRGFAQGVTTARLARELGRDRKHLLELRRAMPGVGLTATRWEMRSSRPTRCTRMPARRAGSTPTPRALRGVGATAARATAVSPTTDRR